MGAFFFTKVLVEMQIDVTKDNITETAELHSTSFSGLS